MPIISNFPTGGGSGGGLALAAVTNIETVVSSGKVYVKWNDPDDLVVAESTLASWEGTLLVRKAGSMPVSRRDGTVVLDSKVRDAYLNAYFCDSGLTNGVTYYYKFYPYTTTNTYTESEDNEFVAVPNAIQVGNVSGMSTAEAGNGKMSIKWTDPSATVVADGITIATWEKTTVVVKAGSYATSPDDANAAYTFNSTTRNAYASTGLIVSGLTNGVTYYISFFPTSTDGAVNVNTSNRITGVPNRMEIATVPSQSGSLTYNGSAQTPTWSNNDSTKMTLGGTTTGTNAGTYSATFTPTNDYCWSDGTTTAKIVSWTIGKASGTLTVSPSTITLNKTNLTDTFTIGGNHDGTVTVTSSDTAIATVSKSGNTVTVSHVNKATGTATITVKVAAGTNYTAPSNKTVAVTAKFTTIYGVQWAGTSATSMTRTDASADFTDPVPAVSNGNGSSPFDGLMPWSGMVESVDSEAGTLVAIPKFWYKWTKSGTKMTLQIADGESDGFYVSPAHADRGDGHGERDVVYVGRYHCASTYKSTTGVAQKVSITRSTARTQISNLGDTIWQWDFAIHWTIQMLYLVEFADWNSQTHIGYGCSASGSKVNNGQTDAMTYHTGTTASSRTTYGYCQYRHIEGLWDNVYDWMDGCYYKSGLNVIMNPEDFSDSANGTNVGTPTSGYPSALTIPTASGLEWAVYPSESDGSTTTYIPDSWGYSSSYPCLFVGGSYSQILNLGLFYVSYGSASDSSASIGCRLMKLP